MRRQRFVEAGGTLPETAADKALLEAILASGEFLPELLFADPGALPRLIADPWLRQPKPPHVIAREVRGRAPPARPVSPSCSAVCVSCGATRCCGSACASLAGGRPTRSLASCPGSPTPAWTPP